MTQAALRPFSLKRLASAAETLRQQLLRTVGALRDARVPYAIGGDCAVAHWVSRVDEAAARNTQDVDVLIRRADFEAARSALERAGFVYRYHTRGLIATRTMGSRPCIRCGD